MKLSDKKLSYARRRQIKDEIEKKYADQRNEYDRGFAKGVKSMESKIEAAEKEWDEMKALLESADNILMQLEDVTHGPLGEDITKVRKRMKTLNQ